MVASLWELDGEEKGAGPVLKKKVPRRLGRATPRLELLLVHAERLVSSSPGETHTPGWWETKKVPSSWHAQQRQRE